MATALDYPPLPGTWVQRAQDALDALSAMTTIDEVVDVFGNARILVDAILGPPIAGGAGTRRAVRATGALLTHRLGPALAAEALSWAASAAEMVSPTGIEEFLEAAADSTVVRGPLRLDDRHVLNEHLAQGRTDAQRRRELGWWWRSRTDGISYPYEFDNDDDDQCYMFRVDPVGPACWAADAPPCDSPEHPFCWLGPEAGPPIPTSADLFTTEDDEAQVAVFDLLNSWEQASVASDLRVFDLHESLIARCLLDHTAEVLVNPACPNGLRDRVRYPHDAATLELAVRAGAGHFEVAKVRRLLAELDDRSHEHFISELPRSYLRARQVCGLNTLEALTTGRLAGLDLSDRDTAEAALGTSDSWHWRRLPDQVVEILIHHPQAADLAWTLTGRTRGNVLADVARRLVGSAAPKVARLALRHHIPVEDLEAQDAPLALANGDYWAARCPGIPAAARPAMRIPTIHEWLGLRATWRDDIEPWPSSCQDGDKPFAYPELIEDLQCPYPEAPGWTVSLPETPAALAVNADAMRNCTRSYASDIHAGRTFILIIEGPDGQRYNAAVERSSDKNGTRYRVGEVNGWANQGERPAWIAPAINARLTAGLSTVEPPEPPVRRRRPRRRRRTHRSPQDRRRR